MPAYEEPHRCRDAAAWPCFGSCPVYEVTLGLGSRPDARRLKQRVTSEKQSESTWGERP
jgi:hypothetical protein